MKRIIIAVISLFATICAGAQAQQPVLIHSHNDYAQQAPFWLAYALHARTVECDMFHVKGSKFLIGHDRSDFSYNQDFDDFYLEPIVRMIRYNGGQAWNDDADRELQLMIDVKSEDVDTFLNALARKLKKYPDVFDRSVNPHACLVVITGNSPAPEDFWKYPSFLSFDGNLNKEYTPSQLERVALFSEYFGNWSDWDGKSEPSSEQLEGIREAVEKAHALGKQIRFWGGPDSPLCWDTFISLGVDYINTDKLVMCTEYLKNIVPDGFTIHGGSTIRAFVEPGASPVLKTAFQMFSNDLKTVLGAGCTESEDADLIVVTADDADYSSDPDVSAIIGHHEAFVIKVLDGGRLLVVGSDAHGAAYGLMELSGMLGVSPWEWWADSTPAPLDKFSLPAGFKSVQEPSVAYRGIFINDEDFGLNPWAWTNHEPSAERGVIGPKTNARIFELLLRLKANLYWPAMHGVSMPFFLVDGNREVAAKYGIYIGSSHCEPMACNANGEWRRRGQGNYDFINNREKVEDFWRARVQDVAGQEIIYTLGMRGVHDGPMEGVDRSDTKGQRDALVQVLEAQRQMLSDCVNPDLKSIPQVFIPYKEVLLAYNEGLEVPDDVTLMWCDDNYGYIRHFPTDEERARSGGNGIYYHVSYWGRPHDYLWLGTTSPALIQQQMGYAFDRGIDRMWILNVGDLKPAEYQIELFMDMAWDMDGVRSEGVRGHLESFLAREFGDNVAGKTADMMMEHYRLAYIHKPEFMGNTRTEEKDPAYKIVKDLPVGESAIKARLAAYDVLYDQAGRIADEIPRVKQDAYYQLVQYPVQCAALMNTKILKAQLARHGNAEWKESDAAYDEIVAMTERYNNEKWNGIISCTPHDLAVYHRIPHESVDAPLLPDPERIATLNAADGEGDAVACEGLGYDQGAALVPRGGSISFNFTAESDSVLVSVRLVPTHPVTGGKLRFTLSLDGNKTGESSYETYDRSEEWKENVLWNQSVREFRMALAPGKLHTLTFTSLDDGVILDQILMIKQK